MKTLTAVVDDSFIEKIDGVIKKTKLYSSRSEFLKDSIRKNLIELIEFDSDLELIRTASKKLATKAKNKGWDTTQIKVNEKRNSLRKLLKNKKLNKK